MERGPKAECHLAYYVTLARATLAAEQLVFGLEPAEGAGSAAEGDLVLDDRAEQKGRAKVMCELWTTTSFGAGRLTSVSSCLLYPLLFPHQTQLYLHVL